MSSTYEKATFWLEKNTQFLSPFVRKNRLLSSRTRDFFERVSIQLGRPQDSFPIIQVAGSKGKGTTAFFIAKILAKAGLKTGLVTSPHLVDQRERALIDFCLPTREEYGQSILEIASVCDRVSGTPTYSGTMALSAINLFRKLSVDVAIVECGLGGANDATGFLDNEIAVLTSLELEHTAQLGSSLAQIAREKALVVSKNGVLFHGTLPDSLVNVLQECVDSKNASRVCVQTEATTVAETCYLLAQAVADRFLQSRSISSVEFDFREVLVAGRRDIREFEGAKLLFDGAHTLNSLSALAEEVPQYFSGEPSLIFSVTAGRDSSNLSRVISPAVGKKYFVSMLKGRSVPVSCPQGFELIEFSEIVPLVRTGGEFMVTGSFHLVGDVMKILKIAPYSERSGV